MSTGIAALLGGLSGSEPEQGGLLVGTVTQTTPSIKVLLDGAVTATTAIKTVPVFVGDRVIVEVISKSAYITRNINFDSGWIYPSPLGSGWVAAGGWAAAGYRRINGIVHLGGTMINGTIGQAPFFLPTGYRPLSTGDLGIWGTSITYGRTKVRASDGAVYLDFGGANGAWQLDGLSFPADA